MVCSRELQGNEQRPPQAPADTIFVIFTVCNLNYQRYIKGLTVKRLSTVSFSYRE